MDRKRLRIIYEKTKGKCWYCGSWLHPLGDWEVEHQHPRAQGGSDHSDNLVPACRACNSRKGNRTVEQYRHSLLVKLEHAITDAFELSEEIEALVGWQKTESDGSDYPSEDLSHISSLLGEAGDEAVNLNLVFHGERRDVVTPFAVSAVDTELVV